MGDKKIVLAALFLLISACAGTRAWAQESQASPPGSPPEPYVPSAEVSLVTVSPKEINLNGKANQAEATVAVQIFHQKLESPQAVALSMGTYTTDPQTGVSVDYDPPSQTVHLRPGAAGKVNATVKVSKPRIGANAQATVVIVADIKPASPGIRIENDNPSMPNHQATLTIRSK
jgi:hypothetical protein